MLMSCMYLEVVCCNNLYEFAEYKLVGSSVILFGFNRCNSSIHFGGGGRGCMPLTM